MEKFSLMVNIFKIKDGNGYSKEGEKAFEIKDGNGKGKIYFNDGKLKYES